MQMMSSIRKDFLVSHLLAQIQSLNRVIEEIENTDATDCDYVGESVKKTEESLRQIRKLCLDN